uniref:Fibroin light chain n=1 Tax=Dendrolimus spectabilis TaxID=155323 RepID=Q9BLL7_9NEOP|nr:fibroin L-chain [Dendrolimus spectabilis]
MMRPIVLVLLFATSALAAPSVLLKQYSENEVAPTKDNGKQVSSYLTDRTFDLFDGGDNNIYILNAMQLMNDFANSGDSYSQARALAQTIATAIDLSSGIPGDACASADVANAYSAAVRSGNPSGFRSALNRYIKYIASNLDSIVRIANNPNSGRYSVGPSGGCSGGGRSYDFESVWQSVLAGSSSSLDYEGYCVAKRLYSAFNVRSNNIGAAITATSIPQVINVFEAVLGPASTFLRTIANGGNAAQAAGKLRSALVNAASRT